MSAISSRQFRIRFACSAALLLAGVLVCRPVAAQLPDEALVGELARLLAAADARVLDASLLETALRSADRGVRRQAALAAGRIGDPTAVPLLLPALSDSDATVQANAAFSLGLLKSPSAVSALLELVRGVPAADQGAPQVEAAMALARIGGLEAGRALRDIVGNGTTAGVATPRAVSAALVAVWRLEDRGFVGPIGGYVDDPDPVVRLRALFALGRLRAPKGGAALVGGLRDPDPRVRAVAARGLTRALLDSAHIQWKSVADALRPLLTDSASAVRVNALRALAAVGDSSVASSATSHVSESDINVAVQAETTLGVLGGSSAIAALVPRAQSPVFALRRQALIALAQADHAAGAAAAASVATDVDWRWRSVAAEAFGAAHERDRLEALLADPDGRVVAQALQALVRVVPGPDTALAGRARTLLEHPDAAVRSVAADLLATQPAIGDVAALTAAYTRAAGDPFDDARLSAVSALAAIAHASTDGRLQVATRFVGTVPRPDDYLVRRLAATRLPDAAAQWGPATPIATGRTDGDYRDVARRYLAPALAGQPLPRVSIETDRGTLIVELLADQAPLTVAAFLSLVDRHYFDGSRWHRAVPNFVIQDGDPRGDGWGGPGFVLRDELNPTPYETGTVGMALSGPDTGGSQFFITHSPQPHLDGRYTVFGQVVTGMDVVDRLQQWDTINTIRVWDGENWIGQ
jgi:cyclophilin family peptidyl-prolyl cis-trans isomerase